MPGPLDLRHEPSPLSACDRAFFELRDRIKQNSPSLDSINLNLGYFLHELSAKYVIESLSEEFSKNCFIRKVKLSHSFVECYGIAYEIFRNNKSVITISDIPEMPSTLPLPPMQIEKIKKEKYTLMGYLQENNNRSDDDRLEPFFIEVNRMFLGWLYFFLAQGDMTALIFFGYQQKSEAENLACKEKFFEIMEHETKLKLTKEKFIQLSQSYEFFHIYLNRVKAGWPIGFENYSFHNRTPLRIAFERNQYELFCQLLSLGADVFHPVSAGKEENIVHLILNLSDKRLRLKYIKAVCQELQNRSIEKVCGDARPLPLSLERNKMIELKSCLEGFISSMEKGMTEDFTRSWGCSSFVSPHLFFSYYARFCESLSEGSYGERDFFRKMKNIEWFPSLFGSSIYKEINARFENLELESDSSVLNNRSHV